MHLLRTIIQSKYLSQNRNRAANSVEPGLLGIYIVCKNGLVCKAKRVNRQQKTDGCGQRKLVILAKTENWSVKLKCSYNYLFL